MARRFSIAYFAVVGAVALAQSALADDWPHLRGPNFDGVCAETGLANEWPAAGPPILWSRELGQGYSGFIVAGGKAFTQFQELSGQYLVCLDPASGQTVWRLRYDAAWQRSGTYPGPYATPTWHEGRVYFASPSGLVGAADATGSLVWSRNLLREFGGRGAGFGFACTPLVIDGVVVFPVGGPGASMVALDAVTGALLWKAGDDPASYCPAFPITLRGQRLIVGYLRNALVLHDLKTGRILVRRPLSADYDEHSAWPIYREPDLLLAAPFQLGAQMLRLEEKADGIAPHMIWSNPQLANDVMSSVLHDGHVYGFDLKELQARNHRTSRGTFRCLDFTTGKVRWSTDAVGHASLIVADGKMVLLNDTGTLILARADPAAYVELGRCDVLPDGDMCWTPPTLWNGRAFLRNHHRATCVYLGRPETLTAQQREQATSAAALPVAQIWNWLWLIGREPDFPNDAPSWEELTTWYLIGSGLFAVAALLALAVYAALPWLGQQRSAHRFAVVFWTAAFGLGIAATPALGHYCTEFVWTWPVALYVAFQMTIQTIVWAESSAAKARNRWLSRAAVLLMLGLCWLYYVACQQLGLATAWSFLIGFLPAWPFAVVAAKLFARGALCRYALCAALAWSIFYWSGGAFIAWKTSMAEFWEHL